MEAPVVLLDPSVRSWPGPARRGAAIEPCILVLGNGGCLPVAEDRGLLPAEAKIAGWDLYPLGNAAFPRRQPVSVICGGLG